MNSLWATSDGCAFVLSANSPDSPRTSASARRFRSEASLAWPGLAQPDLVRRRVEPSRDSSRVENLEGGAHPEAAQSESARGSEPHEPRSPSARERELAGKSEPRVVAAGSSLASFDAFGDAASHEPLSPGIWPSQTSTLGDCVHVTRTASSWARTAVRC